jgi:hypothetical protein
MKLLVRDLSTLNPNTDFRNDVQLSDYRSDKNYDLLKGYMFTAGSFTGKKSSVDLLNTLYRAVADSLENRFLIQATYGHGKSHYGLALANFFGKAVDSPEIKVLLENVSYTVNDAAEVGNLKTFKRNRKPFLVVMLRGDEPGNLRDKFLRGLDRALEEHESTRDVRPPLWFDAASSYVESLYDDQVTRAEAFLGEHQLDIAGLLRRLKDRQSDLYDLCVDLCRKVSNVPPDFGGETSLSEAVKWVVEELCGHDKDFGGMLILFDEFNVFVSDYKTRQGTEIHLQELMNGVSNHRGDVLFVAFAQHEPEAFVKNDGTPATQAFLRVLNRIPQRFRLHSSLEDVLEAYFRIDDQNWQEFMRLPKAGMQVADASDTAYEAFKRRYLQVLQWDTEKFQEGVAKGCFPMHPLTTALLASVELEATATTRSVLGFITDSEGEVRAKLDEPVIIDGRVNWILPTTLVDYFEDMLGEQVWQQYKAVNVPDLTEVQRAALKSMVLQVVGGIQTNQIGYANLIGHLSGYPEAEARRALQSLEEQRYIRYDSTNKTYSFWSGSNGAMELDRLLNKKMEELSRRQQLGAYLDVLDQNHTNPVNKYLSEGKQSLLESYPVTTTWGHPDDWSAQEVVLTRASFTYANLERLLTMCHSTLSDFPKHRGLVVLLVGESQEEVNWFRNEAQQVLDTSAKLKVAPLVLLRPNKPTPSVKSLLIKYALMYEKGFSDSAIHEIGTQVFTGEKERLEKQIRDTLVNLRGDSTLEVPLDARGSVNALSLQTGSTSRITSTLKEVFRVVYHKGPNKWFPHYKRTQAALKNAVSDLIAVLASNNMSNARAGLTKVAAEAVDQFLEGEWGVLTHQNQLQPPTSQHLQHAWKHLDGAFAAGDSKPIRSALTPFLNSPFGYDENTLTLLFCSWYGFHRRDLDIVHDGRPQAIDEKYVADGKGRLKPGEFLTKLSTASVYRRDPQKQVSKIEQVIDGVEKGGVSSKYAAEAESKLRRFKEQFDNADSSLLNRVEAALRKVVEGLSLYESYNQSVDQIQTSLSRARSISDFAGQLRKIEGLREPFTVASENVSPSEMREAVLEQIRSTTEAQCKANERLTRLTDFGKQEEALKNMKAELARLHLERMGQRVDEALGTLSEEKGHLLAAQQEEQHLRTVEQIALSAAFAELLKSEEILKHYVEVGAGPVKERAAIKLRKVQEKIKGVREFVVNLPDQLDTAQSAQAARAAQNSIRENRSKYEGSSSFQDIEKYLGRSARLEEYFRLLEQHQSPATRKQAVGHLATLAELPVRYAKDLSPLQVRMAREATERIQQHIALQEKAARVWLERLAARLQDGDDLNRLERELNSPHPYLSEEFDAQLSEMRGRLHQSLGARQQEQQTLAAIQAIPTLGPLMQLQDSRTYLEGLTESTPAIASALTAKKNQVNTAIASLTDRVDKWDTKLGDLCLSKDIEQLGREILSNWAYFDGSSQFERVEQIFKRTQQVAELLRQAESKPLLHTVNDFEQRLEKLRELESVQELSGVQREAIVRVGVITQELLEKKRTEAHEWLVKCEDALASADADTLAKLESTLRVPPGFLPDAELDQIEILRGRVAAKQDENVAESIAARFKQIKDPAKRKACLERLQALLQEPASTA